MNYLHPSLKPKLKLQSGLFRSKAAGPDHIQPEHLQYGGDLLVQHLTTLFNLIVRHEFVPCSFQHGLTVPIPKSSDKDPTNPSNYRGITLLSIIGKLFEKVI